MFLAAALVGWIGGDFVYRKVAAKNICDEEEKEEEERQIFGLSGVAVKWPWHDFMQLFWYLYVPSVDDSTLMSIFDHFLFSFVFRDCQNRP